MLFPAPTGSLKQEDVAHYLNMSRRLFPQHISWSGQEVVLHTGSLDPLTGPTHLLSRSDQAGEHLGDETRQSLKASGLHSTNAALAAVAAEAEPQD